MRQWMLATCFATALTIMVFVPQDAYAGTCPKNCISWFDGCNTCQCRNGRTTICTKKFCKRKGRAYCKKRKRVTRCPKRCAVWYDGCNTCQCRNGRITACTRRACKRYGRAYCKKKACPTCRTMRCRKGYTCKNIKGCGKCVRKRSKKCPRTCAVWYDGCNTCQCRNGRITACTKRACLRRGRAYCKKRR